MVIHKITLEVADTQEISIQGLVDILSIEVQGGVLTMWFLRNESERNTNVKVTMRGTGHNVSKADIKGMYFMGTHLMAGGQLVWHIWTQILSNRSLS